MSRTVYTCPIAECDFTTTLHKALSMHANRCIKLAKARHKQSQKLLGKRARNTRPMHAVSNTPKRAHTLRTNEVSRIHILKIHQRSCIYAG